MKIYLASPFFNETELANISRAVEILKAKGLEVFVPMEHDVENKETLSNAQWAEEIFKIDKNGIDSSDAVVLLYGGIYSDSGTAWEAGYAMAAGKRTVQILCGEPNTTYSMMMISSADKVVEYHNVENWEEISAELSLDKVIQK